MARYSNRSLTPTVWGFVIFLGLLFLLFLPVWPYSIIWGYYPAGALGVILVVFITLALLGGFAVADREPQPNFKKASDDTRYTRMRAEETKGMRDSSRVSRPEPRRASSDRQSHP